MVTVKSRFDVIPTDPSQQNDGIWLSTYSRGLCSIYPKDEDDCWDYLLSTQSSAQSAAIPERISRSTSNTPSLSSSLPDSLNNAKGGDALLMPLSPGNISHAFCKIGFDCIDYFTATQDDLASEPPKPSASPNNTQNTAQDPAYTSRMLEDLSDSDWRTGLAAAVCGKRTAALERKRALSRTLSQEDVVATTTTDTSKEHWFETLDRLARWDEVAYR
ncbi:hypothetical protein EDD21DRAFT_379156 [Dissophora ornata]|nr:hypothetical protein BGZ58_006321 [Dissophora ornata]KAI8599683.1 hypothetical protein EDD21DRAFT_379156 [Dissophora ornata]